MFSFRMCLLQSVLYVLKLLLLLLLFALVVGCLFVCLLACLFVCLFVCLLVWFGLVWFGLFCFVLFCFVCFFCFVLFVRSFVPSFVSSSSSPACFSALQSSNNKLSQKRVHRLEWCLWDCEVPFLADPMVPIFVAVGHHGDLKDSNHAILCGLKHQVHRNCHLETCRTSNIHGIFVEHFSIPLLTTRIFHPLRILLWQRRP